MAPTSQKAGVRPISFLLSDGRTGGLTSVNLNIRPEDLSRQDPSRVNVEQTLGGAWVDNFGPGLSSIAISGHTGWRGGIGGDGATMFGLLRDTVFTQWHALRNQAVAAGQDPDLVKLIYADALDNITAVVVPLTFVLKRNRTRPLLMMYQINMLVIQDGVATQSNADSVLTGSDLASAGLDSLNDSLSKLTGYAADASSFIDSTFIQPAQSFLTTANGVIGAASSAVKSANGAISGQVGQIVGLARDIAQVGRNAFQTYNAVANLADEAMWSVSRVSAAFENAFCVLNNAFNPRLSFPDFSGVYGASNCSSTAGGSPLSPFANENTFDQIIEQFSAPARVSNDAQTNINVLKATDPVLAPLGIGDLSSRMVSIANGVVLT